MASHRGRESLCLLNTHKPPTSLEQLHAQHAYEMTEQGQYIAWVIHAHVVWNFQAQVYKRAHTHRLAWTADMWAHVCTFNSGWADAKWLAKHASTKSTSGDRVDNSIATRSMCVHAEKVRKSIVSHPATHTHTYYACDIGIGGRDTRGDGKIDMRRTDFRAGSQL